MWQETTPFPLSSLLLPSWANQTFLYYLASKSCICNRRSQDTQETTPFPLSSLLLPATKVGEQYLASKSCMMRRRHIHVASDSIYPCRVSFSKYVPTPARYSDMHCSNSSQTLLQHFDDAMITFIRQEKWCRAGVEQPLLLWPSSCTNMCLPPHILHCITLHYLIFDFA